MMIPNERGNLLLVYPVLFTRSISHFDMCARQTDFEIRNKGNHPQTVGHQQTILVRGQFAFLSEIFIRQGLRRAV